MPRNAARPITLPPTVVDVQSAEALIAVVDRWLARQKLDEAPGTRLDVIARVIGKRRGATIDEVATALLSAFPRRGPRLKFRPATFAEMRTYASRALDHMNTGRVGQRMYRGRVQRRGERFHLGR